MLGTQEDKFVVIGKMRHVALQARLLILWVLEVINSCKICGAKENIG
jgi:hypothetical protein